MTLPESHPWPPALKSLFGDTPSPQALFLPAIYEHKAALITSSPSSVARDKDLLVQAMRAEFDMYKTPIIVAGIDVYNVEAEAMGAAVRYDESGNGVPAISEPVLKEADELDRISLPDPETAGRMPLFLAAAEEAARHLRGKALIAGAVSGPFSLASELLGAEALMMGLLEAPEAIEALLHFCARVSLDYALAFRARGLDVFVFDSRATPDLISPDLYRTAVSSHHAGLMGELAASGARLRPLIIGGNTATILDSLAASGANLLIADHNADPQPFLSATERYPGLAVRFNLPPQVWQTAATDQHDSVFSHIVTLCQTHPRCAVGTGVVPYETPPEHIVALQSRIRQP